MSPIDPKPDPHESEAKLRLMIEEYKTLRDEIARFLKQQKQTIIGSVATGAIALFAGTLKTDPPNITDHPYLLLFPPLILAPLGILFFETEISIYNAGYYLGVKLKRTLQKTYPKMRGAWEWENFRAGGLDGKTRLVDKPWSQWILFLYPCYGLLLCYVVLSIVGGRVQQWHN